MHGLSDLLKGGHFELVPNYETVEWLEIHYNVIPTIFFRILQGYVKSFFPVPNSMVPMDRIELISENVATSYAFGFLNSHL